MPARRVLRGCLVLLTLLLSTTAARAQDPKPGEPGFVAPPAPFAQAVEHFGSSPFPPPEANDQTFVVDRAGGLDTGCTFRSGGPLRFTIEVGRVVGDVQKLRANGLISEQATLRMPAFDVDFDGGGGVFNPERDRILFNGDPVSPEFLSGSNNEWKLNAFQIPIGRVRFATEGGSSPTPGRNDIEIHIDTANSEEVWCTAIDWAALSVDKIVRPVVMAHGIFSKGEVWDQVWARRLGELGILHNNELDMGNLGSIGGNAGQIAGKVAEVREEWGVDKVVLVGHSKGGIDSRHYVEGSDDVEQLLQVGTPNAGSPLADKIQAGAVRALGPVNAILLNLVIGVFQGPAGVQLTTPYMNGYNLFHGSNPDVRYTALAGDYNPDCPFFNPFCRPVQRLLLALSTSPGDTIVPVSSVHALGFIQSRTFSSQGTDMAATHACAPAFIFTDCQLSTDRSFDNLSDRVRASGQAARLGAAAAAPELATTASVGGAIEAGQTVVRQIPVDQPEEAFFTLFYPGGQLDLALVSPSGRRIDPVTVASATDASFEELDLFGGRLAVYDLSPVEPGLWTLEVTAVSVPDPTAPVGFVLSALVEGSPFSLSGRVVEPAVPVGAPLALEATPLEDGAPVPGASVEASIVLPGGSFAAVALADDGGGADAVAGDGTYSGTFPATTEAGLYRIALAAEGVGSAGTPFSRDAFVLATVRQSETALTGVFRDFGLDTDGDGFFNELVIEVDLDVTDSRDYRVFGVLTDSRGNVHQANVVEPLVPGIATVSLRFDGEAIFENGVDGPYTLSVLRVAEEDGLAILPVAERLDAHVTALYGFIEFQHAPISLTGGGTSAGRDVNGNGLFDFLDVTFDVRLEQSGFYTWSARLVDESGFELGFESRSGFFPTGVSSLGLSFPGLPIGRRGVDGPYRVVDLLLFGAGQSLVAPRVLLTQPFEAEQFEGFSVDVTPPELSVSLTPSQLWPPDHRLVEVAAEVTVTDDVDPDPVVELVSVVSNEPDDGLGDGDTAGDVQGAAVGMDDRLLSLRAERSGLGDGRTYTVTYRATDAAGNSTEASATVTVPLDRRSR